MHRSPITVYCDGLCEPNPGGIATCGWVVYRGKRRLKKFCSLVCSGPGATNNLAEYSAVISALEWLLDKDLHDRQIEICTDSQLVAYQLTGRYSVKSPFIIPLFKKANGMINLFMSVKVKWIPREQNKEADKLSKKAYQRTISIQKKSREYKAKQIVPTVIPLSGGRFNVPSQTYADVVYLVDNHKNTCTCPDFQMRGRKIGYCKHLLAVRLHLSGGKERGAVAL